MARGRWARGGRADGPDGEPAPARGDGAPDRRRRQRRCAAAHWREATRHAGLLLRSDSFVRDPPGCCHHERGAIWPRGAHQSLPHRGGDDRGSQSPALRSRCVQLDQRCRTAETPGTRGRERHAVHQHHSARRFRLAIRGSQVVRSRVRERPGRRHVVHGGEGGARRMSMSHELKTGGDRGYLRIATEEAFATREQIDCYLRMVNDGTGDKGLVSLWGFYARSPSERATQILERLLDLGEQRIRHMDKTGIDKAVLALTAPGAQPLTDLTEARRLAQRANDYLAGHVACRPDRYVGMTTVAPQDPDWSATEILRGARELGFKGVQINSHTQGQYLDHPRFDPIFRALADTGQPLYIHPAT